MRKINESFEIDLPSFIEGLSAQSIENLKLPDPKLLRFYKDLNHRKIWLDFDIFDEGIVDYGKMIIDWNEDDSGIKVESRIPIHLYIHTNGGSLTAANYLIDIIRMSKTPVYTFNMGKAHSAGAFIFLAGHKRYIMPRAQVLLHAGSINDLSGNTHQVFETTDNMKKMEKKIKEYVLSRTTINSSTYTKNLKKEWYFDAEECIKYGIADKIVNDIDILL